LLHSTGIIVIYETCPPAALLSSFHHECTRHQSKALLSATVQWNLTWNDTLHGSNRVEKMFGNCTIHENFSDAAKVFLGQSWSVYNPASQQWQQTWVDNQGGYIPLTGGMQGDSMVLKTAERQTPKGIQQMRMVYHNIRADSFDWSWDASTDKGLTWKTNWKIHYERRK
jgi:hypothetical protein